MAKQPNWTAEELNLLKEVYPKYGRSEELKNAFPTRTIEGICLKANRIGLKVINNIREKRTNNEYISLLENTNFIALEEYRGSTVPIKHMCSICDYEWEARPQQVLRPGALCPICSHSARMKSNEEVDKVLSDAGYKRHSEYHGSIENILVEHLSCGYIWETKYSYIQQGSGCPICNKGFGQIYNKDNIPQTAWLYIVKISIDNESFIKIGITCRKPNNRIREIKSEITKRFKNSEIEPLIIFKGQGTQVLHCEKYILDNFMPINTDKVFAGKTECFPNNLLLDFVEYLEKELNVEGF